MEWALDLESEDLMPLVTTGMTLDPEHTYHGYEIDATPLSKMSEKTPPLNETAYGASVSSLASPPSLIPVHPHSMKKGHPLALLRDKLQGRSNIPPWSQEQVPT